MRYHFGSVIQADTPDVTEVRYSGNLTSPVLAHWAGSRPTQFVGIKTTSYFAGTMFICLQ